MLVSLMEKFVEDVRICAAWQIYNDLISDLTTFICLQKKIKNPGHASLFSWEIVLVDTIQSLVWMVWFNALLLLLI